MSVPLDLNTYYQCETCRHADEHGRMCNVNTFLPILLMMHGERGCEHYKFQNKDEHENSFG